MISRPFCRTTHGLIIFPVVDGVNAVGRTVKAVDDVVVVGPAVVKMLIAFSALGQC
jgi:hypothetical protein